MPHVGICLSLILLIRVKEQHLLQHLFPQSKAAFFFSRGISSLRSGVNFVDSTPLGRVAK
jgi:hypothetical protein